MLSSEIKDSQNSEEELSQGNDDNYKDPKENESSSSTSTSQTTNVTGKRNYSVCSNSSSATKITRALSKQQSISKFLVNPKKRKTAGRGGTNYEIDQHPLCKKIKSALQRISIRSIASRSTEHIEPAEAHAMKITTSCCKGNQNKSLGLCKCICGHVIDPKSYMKIYHASNKE